MNAPEHILQIYQDFEAFPMETLTKAWVHKNGGPRQRHVDEMRDHRAKFGASGNCFDLTFWLWDEFDKGGVEAYAIGHDLGKPEAHVAICALDDQGKRYLCDLGDLWTEPILIDHPGSIDEKHRGFFPGADVAIDNSRKDTLAVDYFRPGGKKSHQVYDLKPISLAELRQAGEKNQSQILQNLIEVRLKTADETVHWEFQDFKSFTSSMSGLAPDEPLSTVGAWCACIEEKTGICAEYLSQCFEAYRYLKGISPSWKSASIVDLVNRLDLQARGWSIADHWESDLCAIGIAHSQRPGRLVYISTYNANEGLFYYECENRKDGAADFSEFETVEKQGGVTFEQLVEAMTRHFKG